MVYETKTYKLCHTLSESGKEAYNKILEDAATEMIFKKQHPIKWFLEKLIEFFEK